jgi:hypothetical protein
LDIGSSAIAIEDKVRITKVRYVLSITSVQAQFCGRRYRREHPSKHIRGNCGILGIANRTGHGDAMKASSDYAVYILCVDSADRKGWYRDLIGDLLQQRCPDVRVKRFRTTGKHWAASNVISAFADRFPSLFNGMR